MGDVIPDGGGGMRARKSWIHNKSINEIQPNLNLRAPLNWA